MIPGDTRGRELWGNMADCKMNPMTHAYDEIIDFIAGGNTSDEVANWKPSRKARDRVWELLRKEKSKKLDAQERAELDRYMELEHLMRLAKARARQRVGNE